MGRGKLNLALLIVAAALGAAVWFSQEKEEKGPPLTALKPDMVTRIALEHPGHETIRLEKRDGSWQLTAPIAVAAEQLEVNALLGLADQETKETLKPEGLNLAELGLSPPGYTITLNDTAIQFGGTEPLQYRRYVRTGEQVALVEDPPSAALDADYADLVAKSLLPPAAELERLELPKLTLARAEAGWSVTPKDPKGTADSMQKLADGWKNARALWNERPKDKPRTAGKGDTVRVVLKGGAEHRFAIVERDPQFKLHRADLGITYVLSKTLEDELLKLPEPPPPPADEPLADAPPPAPGADAPQ